MSLLYDSFEDFFLMNKTTADDGYGGVTTVWTEGASIKAAAVPIATNPDLQAQKIELSRIYEVTTEKSILLRHHDVIKRKSDSLMLEISEDGTDQKTPPSAMLNMRVVKAEVFNG